MKNQRVKALESHSLSIKPRFKVSSQDPPQIDHNCCYECGDSLDGIFCQRCICKSCGKGAYYGYNCPPKDPIISKPEPCNQTINELPQILLNIHPTCIYEDENSFIYDSKPHSFNVSPSVFNQSPQPQFETYLCELCGNNAHYGYDCSPQFPFVYEPEPCYNQNFSDNYYPQNSPSFSQQYLCCAYCGGPHETFQCQPMNEDYCEQNSCYYPNSSGFDHPQPPQDSVDCQETLDKILEELEELKRDQRMLKELKKRIAEEQTAKENMSIEEMRHEQQLVDHKIKEIMNDLGYKRFRGEKIDEEYERDCEIRIRKLKQDSNEWGSKVRKKEQAYEEEKYSAARRYMLSIPFVDEDDYIPLGDIIARSSTSKAVTKPDYRWRSRLNSLEILLPFDALNDNSKFLSDSNNDDTSSDNDDFEDIEYISLEEVNDEKEFDLEDILTSKTDRFLEEVRYFSSHLDILYRIRIEPGQEGLISIDNSNNTLLELPEYESFHFDPSFPRPPPEPPDVEICLYFEPDAPEINNFYMLNNDEPFDPEEDENVVFLNVEEDDSFTFTIRTFLPFLTYPEVSPLSCSTGSEDTIFDPGIFT
ncbi:hypothetical protein Tco_1502375 [Tanacetum coccineum]